MFKKLKIRFDNWNQKRKMENGRPDKIDILFGWVSIICILFSVHMIEVDRLERENTQLMTANEELTSTIEEYGPLHTLVAKATHFDSPVMEEKDFSQMVKSEMITYLNKLENFLKCFEEFGITSEHNVTYSAVCEEYFNCKEALANGDYKYPYSDAEFNLLAYATMKEQGDNRTSDECQKLVACVIRNRQAQNGINGTLKNPTIAEIINEEGQYHFAIVSGYNISSNNIDMSIVTDKVKNNVRDVLEGRYDCPDNVVFQATFPQGSGVYKSFYNEGYGTTTYFCYK